MKFREILSFYPPSLLPSHLLSIKFFEPLISAKFEKLLFLFSKGEFHFVINTSRNTPRTY